MCYSGNRAAKASDLLVQNGYKHVIYVTFGYEQFVNTQEGFEPQVGECPCLAED